ncbi:Tfp pilus assembly protein PilN [Gluconacetobacter johannae DSM 13595]|uniref:PilN domain-containing protein n=1 Tax=Gluconacetobacter johannae TaxID=112140 RepID=A0A7W4P3M1_9PROT|nr:PilN domain-containing protein [Gluconacetobacter johannae]MBB2176157.1 PilN domain-containing protein [Gluconacetobacter johannae]GBQ89358.1 Tfp pilus assembly protein PilN [Gluconacetobacter johannae DSM 13595]
MILGDLFIWWRRQIGEMIPERWRLSRFSARPVIVAALADARLAVSLVRQGTSTPVGGCGLSDGADDGEATACRQALSDALGGGAPASTVLRLPPGLLMQRDVVLPSATGGSLDTVLGYEMDRLTPFPADRIWYAYDILRRDPDHKQLHVRLSIVPRAAVAPALAALARVGLRPDVLEDAASRAAIPMRDAATRYGRPRRARMAMIVAAALLPVVAGAAAFWRQSVEQGHLAARIALLRPEAEQARVLRRQAEDRSAGAGLIARERRRLGDPMEVLAAVTRILPDDSFLTDLILRQGQLIVSGQAAAATGLIQALSTDPLFRTPAFVAPVTRVEGQNASLFSIHAGVGQ